MKFNPFMALAAISLAVAAPAGAAVVNFAQGDLLMGFRATGGTGAGQTYVVDIGSAAMFRDATGSMTLDLGSIGADLSLIFGSSWSTRTDVLWGIIGSPSNTADVGIDPEDTLYASRPQTGSEPGTGWQIVSASSRGAASSRVQGLISAFKAYQASGNSAYAVFQNDADINGWRSYMSPGGVVPSNAPGNADFGVFSELEGTPSQALGLYRLVDSQAGSYEGYFTISNGGVVTYNAVPEPAAAILGGLGVLAVSFRRRRTA